jgi:2-polyprenyl-6-methoxyphenol hydroxylase-like FAD-dependent oxidoreductase
VVRVHSGEQPRTQVGHRRRLLHDRRWVDVDFTRLVAGISDRHIEIMRGELAAILHDATRDEVQYVFGDGIRRLTQDDGGVDVEFEHAAASTS